MVSLGIVHLPAMRLGLVFLHVLPEHPRDAGLFQLAVDVGADGDNRREAAASQAVHRVEAELHVRGRFALLDSEFAADRVQQARCALHVARRAHADVDPVAADWLEAERPEERRDAQHLADRRFDPHRHRFDHLSRQMEKLFLAVQEDRDQVVAVAPVAVHDVLNPGDVTHL
jgi:hypothetical protein